MYGSKDRIVRSNNQTGMVRCDNTLDSSAHKIGKMIEFPEIWSQMIKSDESFPLFLNIGETEMIFADRACLTKSQAASKQQEGGARKCYEEQNEEKSDDWPYFESENFVPKQHEKFGVYNFRNEEGFIDIDKEGMTKKTAQPAWNLRHRSLGSNKREQRYTTNRTRVY